MWVDTKRVWRDLVGKFRDREIYIYIPTYIQTFLLTYMHKCIYACIHIHTYKQTNRHVCIRVYTLT